MKIKQVKIDLIKPYHRNPRKNDSAVDMVAKSIREYGFNVPITVDLKNVIITGHTRYRAARLLELKKVPVVVLDLDPKKVIEYRIADNKSHEPSRWDEDKLISELRLIDDVDSFQEFFPTFSIEDLLAISVGSKRNQTDDDIKAKTTEAETKYEGAEQDGDPIEISCPHCGEVIKFSRGDLESKMRYA